MQPIILIADDHSIIRKGLKLYLQFDLGYTQIHETSSCAGLMKELVKKKYTHLILDIILEDGSTLEIIPNIQRVFPDLSIMVFSMQPEDIYGKALKQYNIRQYLSKSSNEQQIINGLKRFFHNEFPGKSKENLSNIQNPFSDLTPRELEILHYILKGIGTKEISETLNLKMNTVSTLKTRIYEKTNAATVRELMELASLYNINF